MVDVALYTDFVNDKKAFFAKERTFDKVKQKAAKRDHNFLANNKFFIEQEFEHLFSALAKQKDKLQEFWLYCYYCCDMLSIYYAQYRKPEKVEEFNKYKQQIEALCKNQSSPLTTHESFIRVLGKKISDGLKDIFVETPQHINKARSKIGLMNVWRMHLTFLRLTLTNGFTYAQETHLIDKLNRLLGKEINVDKIIKNLNASGVVFRALSVGFLVTRFIINAGMLLKHTFAPSAEESKLSRTKRFKDELWKRHADFLNDIVWAIVNLLTNYAAVFNIPPLVAGWVTAGFLVFDVALLLWRRQVALQEYLLKKSQYKTEFQSLNDKLKSAIEASNPFEQKCLRRQIVMNNEQSEQLEIKWKATTATYLFNAAAALLLACGFSASLIFTPALAIIASYAVCMLAAAMYLSGDDYKLYKEKSLMLEQSQIENTLSPKILAEYRQARNDFIASMVKKTVLPGLFIATFAICWQAALVLTAAYLAYELITAYLKNKKPTLPPPPPPSDEATATMTLGLS